MGEHDALAALSCHQQGAFRLIKIEGKCLTAGYHLPVVLKERTGGQPTNIKRTKCFKIMSDSALRTVMEVIGWIGSVEILLAYGLNSYQKIKSDSLTFLLLNLTGGLFLITYTFYKEAFANTFLNMAWVLIALFALRKFFYQRPTRKPQP